MLLLSLCLALVGADAALLLRLDHEVGADEVDAQEHRARADLVVLANLLAVAERVGAHVNLLRDKTLV